MSENDYSPYNSANSMDLISVSTCRTFSTACVIDLNLGEMLYIMHTET